MNERSLDELSMGFPGVELSTNVLGECFSINVLDECSRRVRSAVASSNLDDLFINECFMNTLAE